jgi:hypothetical protein
MQIEQPKYEMRKLSELVPWEDNPRVEPTAEAYERLKQSIMMLGLYKPFIVNQQNVILGGTRRRKICEELGIEEVMCSVVLTDNKAQMMDYALSDNDHITITDKKKLKEFIKVHPVHTTLFSIQTKPNVIVSQLREREPKPAQAQPTCRHCPVHCPHDSGQV